MTGRRQPPALRLALLSMGLVATGAAQAADPRRSGYQDMSPALQAMQRDETQNPAMLWVSEGEALWSRPAANGRSCAGCHADGAPAASQPRNAAIRSRIARRLAA